MSENIKLMSSGSSHHYLECIKAAYEFSSSELLNLIKEKVRYRRTLNLSSKEHLVSPPIFASWHINLWINSNAYSYVSAIGSMT